MLPILHTQNAGKRRGFDHQRVVRRRGDWPFGIAGSSRLYCLKGRTSWVAVAADYAAEGIRANCLIVGTVWTPIVAHLGEDARERRRKGVPLQTEGTGWDVAYAAVYLASERWVTGV